MKLQDHAYLVSRDKDTTRYQLAATKELFELINQIDGRYELLFFDCGCWESQGIKTADEIAAMAANIQT